MKFLFSAVVLLLITSSIHAIPYQPYGSSNNHQYSNSNQSRSYQYIGNTTYGSDVSSYQRIGNTIYGSDGSSYQRIGNTTYGSDGSSYQRIGNITYGSDGSNAQRIGNTTYITDANGSSTSCQKIRNITYCN